MRRCSGGIRYWFLKKWKTIWVNSDDWGVGVTFGDAGRMW
jgi:hypothetical protein